MGIIIGALFLVDYFGIYGLAIGVVLGALFHLLIQLPTAYSLGYRYKLRVDFKDKGLKTIIKMMIPRTMALGLTQFNLLVITIIASTLAAGSITIFNLANNLASFPIGIFGISFAIAAFPTLAELADNNKIKKFIESFSATLRNILFLVIPSSALFLVLRAQIVRIILGSGRFDWEDTEMTIAALGFFTFGIFAQSLIPLFARAFYSFHDSRTPFLTGLASAFLNIILSLILIIPYDVAGLALAFSISSIFNLFLMIILFKLQVKNIDDVKIIFSLAKILLATYILSLVCQSAKYLIEPFTGTETFIGLAFQGFVATLLGLASYFLILWLLRSEELFYFINIFKKKFLKVKDPVDASLAR